MARLYVASKFGARAHTIRFCDDAIAAGHQITHNWALAATNAADDDLTDAQARGHAIMDLRGVFDCKVFVLFADDPAIYGALVEFGYALSMACQKFVIAPYRRSIFNYLEGVKVFEDENAVRKQLNMPEI